MDWMACPHTLGDLIDRELELAQRLGEALEGELAALRGVDPTALDAATALKLSCVEQLDALDVERRHFCTALGLGPDRAGMERLLIQADPGGTLTGRWHQLLDRLEHCRETNQRNGALVRLQKRRVTDALGILHGNAVNCAMYGNDGEADETSGHHVHAEI